jgi:CO dehydrogenase maturation factor
MGAVISVCGKGGVGKTTLTALLARLLSADGPRTLVIDADPAGGLAMALGITPKQTLDDLRRELIATASSGGQDAADLLAAADYRLLEALEERHNLAFLAVGRPEEEGCYCKLNTLLRAAIEALADRFDLTLIDAEAGIEQVNRRVMRAVTHLLLVSDLSQKGLRVAEAIRDVTGGSGREVGLVLNRVEAGKVAERLRQSTTLPVVATLPEDPTIRQLDAEARSFLELSESPALEAARIQLLDPNKRVF